MHNYLSAELEINFLDCDQFINEGSISLNVPISLAYSIKVLLLSFSHLLLLKEQRVWVWDTSSILSQLLVIVEL